MLLAVSSVTSLSRGCLSQTTPVTLSTAKNLLASSPTTPNTSGSLSRSRARSWVTEEPGRYGGEKKTAVKRSQLVPREVWMSGRTSSWRAPGSGGVPIPWVSKRHGDKWWDSVDGLGGPEGLFQEDFMVCKTNCCSISLGSIKPSSCTEDHHQLFPDFVLSHLTMDGERQRQDSTFPRVDMSPVSTSIHQCGELPHRDLLHPLSSTQSTSCPAPSPTLLYLTHFSLSLLPCRAFLPFTGSKPSYGHPTHPRSPLWHHEGTPQPQISG